jgi:hypothetical protein
LNSRLMRWSLKLQEYTFDIEYRPGPRHADVDALSRLPPNPDPDALPELCAFMAEDEDVSPLRVEESNAEEYDDLPSETPETRTVPRHIRFDSSDSEDEPQEGDDDPHIEQTEGSGDVNITRPRLADIMDDHYVVDFLRDGTIPTVLSSKERRRVMKRAKSFVMENGTLRTRPTTKHPTGRIIPTLEERERILEWGHKGTNHMGAAKLEKLVAEQNYWWSNLCADCVRTCQDCEDCRIATTKFQTPPLPLKTTY